MNRLQLDDALDSMSRAELETLAAAVEKKLASCASCGGPHALKFRIHGTTTHRTGYLFLCEACYTRMRLPDHIKLDQKKLSEEGTTDD